MEGREGEAESKGAQEKGEANGEPKEMRAEEDTGAGEKMRG